MPFGEISLRKQGSDGGHNGLKNITELLGNKNYARLRVGISDDFSKGRQIDYVLGEWNDAEQKELPFIENDCIDAVKSYVFMGADRAMNIINTKKKEAK